MLTWLPWNITSTEKMTISLFKSLMWPQKEFFQVFVSSFLRDETEINLKSSSCVYTQIIMIIIINKMLLCVDEEEIWCYRATTFMWNKYDERKPWMDLFTSSSFTPILYSCVHPCYVHIHTQKTLLFFCIKHKQNCEKWQMVRRRIKGAHFAK